MSDNPHLLWIPLTPEEWAGLKVGKCVNFIVPAPINSVTGEPEGKATLVLIQPPDFYPDEE